MNIVGLEELAVAAATEHQGIGQFASQAGASFGHQTREPDDATDFVGLGRETGLVQDGVTGHTLLLMQKEVPTDVHDELKGLVVRFSLVFSVVHEIVDFLGPGADRGQEGPVFAIKVGGWIPIAGAKKIDGFLVQFPESRLIVVVAHCIPTFSTRSGHCNSGDGKTRYRDGGRSGGPEIDLPLEPVDPFNLNRNLLADFEPPTFPPTHQGGSAAVDLVEIVSQRGYMDQPVSQ